MITQLARVVGLERGRATLDLDLRSACTACARGQGCGAALPSLFGRRRRLLRVPAEADWRLGQQVIVAMEPRRLLALAWAGYGLPLAGLLAGISAPVALGFGQSGDWLPLVCAVAGCYLGLRWSRRRFGVAPLKLRYGAD